MLEADFEQALAKGEADYPQVVVRRQVAQGAPRGALLEPLVIRQEKGGPVAQAVLVKDPMQPDLLTRGQAKLVKAWSCIHGLPPLLTACCWRAAHR